MSNSRADFLLSSDMWFLSYRPSEAIPVSCNEVDYSSNTSSSITFSINLSLPSSLSDQFQISLTTAIWLKLWPTTMRQVAGPNVRLNQLLRCDPKCDLVPWLVLMVTGQDFSKIAQTCSEQLICNCPQPVDTP